LQFNESKISMKLHPSLVFVLCALSGCGGNGSLMNNAPAAQLQQQPRKLALHLHAATRLNVDARGRPLALLLRVYKLRQRGAFEQAPYAAFLSPQAEREALGADLLEASEVTLVPGQRLDLDQTLAREAGYLGVVALFHTPARQGWRAAFAAPDAEQAGITLGLHACALSVGAGAAASGEPPPSLSLVRCQGAP
jgi:type VI secretion system protein VasD